MSELCLEGAQALGNVARSYVLQQTQEHKPT